MMDEEIKRQYDRGEDKFNDFMNAYGNEEALSERVNTVFEFIKANNPELLAFIFKHTRPLNRAIDDEKRNKQSRYDRDLDLIMVLLLFTDSMVYAGYIEENFLPDELKGKKHDGTFTITTVPTEKFQEIVKKNGDNKQKPTKKHGKKN